MNPNNPIGPLDPVDDRKAAARRSFQPGPGRRPVRGTQQL